MSLNNSLIKITLNLEKGCVLNIIDKLKNENLEDNNIKKINKRKNNVYQNVQSKIGKVVPGYDENDGFIDDSEAINASIQAQTLDPTAFKISLVPTINENNNLNNKIDNNKSKNNEIEIDNNSFFSEDIELLINDLNTLLCPILTELNQKIRNNSKSIPKISINDNIAEVIVKITDEKVKFELEQNKTLSKKKIEILKRDTLNFIKKKCFEAFDKEFCSLRQLQNAYTKFVKKRDGLTKQEENLPIIDEEE